MSVGGPSPRGAQPGGALRPLTRLVRHLGEFMLRRHPPRVAPYREPANGGQ